MRFLRSKYIDINDLLFNERYIFYDYLYNMNKYKDIIDAHIHQYVDFFNYNDLLYCHVFIPILINEKWNNEIDV